MNIFRKNYLPKVVVHQDTNGLWFADNGLEPYNPEYKKFHFDSGLTYYSDLSKFHSLDDLFIALYEYACKEHLKVVKDNITYRRVQVLL